jgi:hypothetical protein
MNKYFVVVAVCAMAGLSMASTASLAQQKTAKACVEEWRANKAANKAAKITEKAYVAQCRTGAAAPAPTSEPKPTAAPAKPAPAPSRTTAAPAPAPTQTTAPTPTAPTRTTTAPVPAPSRPTAPSTTSAPLGAGQYSSETQAKVMCLTDTVVWVNLDSKIYHLSGHKNFGNTKTGAYMCEKIAVTSGARLAKNEKR